jgi:hypothetical protein
VGFKEYLILGREGRSGTWAGVGQNVSCQGLLFLFFIITRLYLFSQAA